MQTVRLILFVVPFAPFAPLALAITAGRSGLQIGVGYSAKELCSGVLASRLPMAFVVETDTAPSLAPGPLRRWLDLRTDPASGLAAASLLGVSATAAHAPPRGCVPGSALPGAPPRSIVAAPAATGVPQPLREAVGQAFAEPAPQENL